LQVLPDFAWRTEDTELLKAAAGGRLREHLEAYVLVGYTADRHRRIVLTEFGADPACGDGLQIMAMAAHRWSDGGMNRPSGGGCEESLTVE
jgi:hypothetical protein